MLVDALADCFAVVASLCVNDSAVAKLTWSANLSGAALEISGANLTSIVGSDNVILPNVRKMHTACAGGRCIYYSGRCSGTDSDYKCNLWYSYTRRMPLRQIEITGSLNQVREIKRKLKIVRSNVSLIPLATLKFDAGDNSPPA